MSETATELATARPSNLRVRVRVAALKLMLCSVRAANDNFWQAISVFMFQGECTVNLNNLFSKPSTPILTWTNPRQSFLGNYDYASHFTYDNSSVSVRFHFLVCCSITFRCIVVDSGNMLFIQVKGTHG